MNNVRRYDDLFADATNFDIATLKQHVYCGVIFEKAEVFGPNITARGDI